MANKGLIALIVIVVLIIVGIIYFTNNSTADKGRAVFAITDAAANMGSITSVEISVDKVEAHSSESGWVTVSSSAQKYSLLELKSSGDVVALADVQLQTGTYDQVRLVVSSVIITDSNGTHTAKLPSGELKVVGGFDVASNSTAAVTFDFIADESIHMTGNGLYIFAPVVQVESRDSAEVDVDSRNNVEVNGGIVKSFIKVGMDENGNVGTGLKISDNVKLSLDTDGKIKIGEGNGNAQASGSLGVNSNDSSSGIGVGINSGYGY